MGTSVCDVYLEAARYSENISNRNDILLQLFFGYRPGFLIFLFTLGFSLKKRKEELTNDYSICSPLQN